MTVASPVYHTERPPLCTTQSALYGYICASRDFLYAELLAIAGSPHAEQVVVNQRLGLESNPGEQTGNFSITL